MVGEVPQHQVFSDSHWSTTSVPDSQEKVDCITVNCEPVKAIIEDLIQRLFDMLLVSLKKSIQGNFLCLSFIFLISVELYIYALLTYFTPLQYWKLYQIDSCILH